jgi:pimeloyl-ACP methyl ester carboxylesterase
VSGIGRALLRPETYPGHAREVASLVMTSAVWPMGWVDRGLAEFSRVLAQRTSPVPTPVVLLHGFGANKSNWLFLQRDLRAAGFERIHAVNYNPFRPLPEIAGLAVRRARAIMRESGTDRVHLVGHSLGGLVARYAVQLGGLEEAATCLTVASPHRGVAPAQLAPGRILRQLRADSPELRRLSASSRRLPTRFVAYYSNLDLLVPGHRAMILEPALAAANVLVKDEGHLSIMFSRRLSASIVHELGASEGLPGYGTPLAGLPATGPGRRAA